MKRANGEGTVFQRKDGRWQGQLSIPAAGLQRATRRTVYGETQREVLDKLRQLEQHVAVGLQPAPNRSMTVAQYREVWINGTKRAEVQRGHNTESTLRNYRDLWDRHIGPDLGHLRLDQLTPPVLRDWLANKAKQHSARGGLLAPTTQNRIYAVLRAALNDAVNDDLLTTNPLDRVRPPRISQKAVQPLDGPQVGALLKALHGDRLFPLVLLMVVTGARPGEALAAAWSDLDLAGSRWHISRSLCRVPVAGRPGSTTLGFQGTKTAASNAIITVPTLAVEELARHRVRQAQQRLAAPEWLDPDLVFTTDRGTPLEPRNVRRRLAQAANDAGLQRNVRLHDLRHTAASALLAEGVGITVTSKLLRHTRLATTSDIYSHLLEEVSTEAAAVMDRRMRRQLE